MSESSPATRSRRKGSWWKRIGAGVLSFIGLSVMVYFFTLVFGSVQGQEFAPDTFARRDFSYYQLPLMQVQVSVVRRKDLGCELCRYMIDKGFISPASSASRWDLVATGRRGRLTQDGDALILCRYLDAVDAEGRPYWLGWTQDHPEMAKVLWPTIAQAARDRQYVLIPQLFRLAWSLDDPVQLQRDLNATRLRNKERSEQLPAEVPIDGSEEIPGGGQQAES